MQSKLIGNYGLWKVFVLNICLGRLSRGLQYQADDPYCAKPIELLI